MVKKKMLLQNNSEGDNTHAFRPEVLIWIHYGST